VSDVLAVVVELGDVGLHHLIDGQRTMNPCRLVGALSVKLAGFVDSLIE
jgi:hypothetical protein